MECKGTPYLTPLLQPLLFRSEEKSEKATKHFNLIKFHVTQIPETVVLSALDESPLSPPRHPLSAPQEEWQWPRITESEKKGKGKRREAKWAQNKIKIVIKKGGKWKSG